MDYISAFIVGGIICVVGQILIDVTKLTPGRILVVFVVLGAILGAFGWYDKLIEEFGYDIRKQHIDCGEIIFDKEKQKTEAGGSGCGCSAVVFTGYLYKKLMKKEIKSLLLVSTGALMSTTSSLQGETIPGIAHAVAIEMK